MSLPHSVPSSCLTYPTRLQPPTLALYHHKQAHTRPKPLETLHNPLRYQLPSDSRLRNASLRTLVHANPTLCRALDIALPMAHTAGTKQPDTRHPKPEIRDAVKDLESKNKQNKERKRQIKIYDDPVGGDLNSTGLGFGI